MATNFSFTFDSYRDLLADFRSNGLEFSHYHDRIKHGTIRLRHDVDWSPERARRIGEIEAEMDVTSTFFFLLTSPFYNLWHEPNRRVVAELRSMGHRVGLHFSTHQYWTNDPGADTLAETVDRELAALSELTDRQVDIVSFHVPPDWVLNRSFGGFVSTYEQQFLDDITYRADSNQRWRDEQPFSKGIPGRLQVLIHPGLWGETDATFEERLQAQMADRFDSIETFLEHQFIEDALPR